MKAHALVAPLALVMAAGCAPKADGPHFNAARAVDWIRNDEVRWNADWKSGDAGRIAAHFAPDAVVMVPGQPPANGLEAIRAGAQALMNDPAFTISFASDKVLVAKGGDLAVARGGWTMTVTDPATKAPVKASGHFVTVYKPQADGSWKAEWNIGSPGAAPAPAAAAANTTAP